MTKSSPRRRYNQMIRRKGQRSLNGASHLPLIEQVEPRLLLSATITSSAATALQTELSHVKDILGAVAPGVEDVTGLGRVVSAAQSLAKDFEGLAKVLTWVSMPSSWVRIFAGVFGAASLGAGIYLIGKEARGS